MLRRWILPLLAFGLIFLPTQIEPVEAQGERQVWAFYMGFWAGGGSWDAQADVLSDYPALGPYDSKDPGIMGAHIDQAMSAGIDAFIVSWFGIEEQVTTTPVLRNALDRAAERGFKVAPAIDVFDADFNRNRDLIIASASWVVNDLANHPGYLRYQGKPILFFAFQDRTNFTAAQWQEIRNAVDPDHNTIWISEGLSGCCLYGGAMDGMYAFNLAWSNGSAGRLSSERSAVLGRGGSYYIPTIHPGWNEDLIAARESRPNPTSARDRAGGQFLANNFNAAVSTGTDVILVVSWNEFIENSHIEPSQQYGSQSLDTLRPLIAAWEGAAQPVEAAPVEEQPSAEQPAITGRVAIPWSTLNVRSGPGTDFDVVGRIEANSVNQIVGEENGWFIISFSGGTGYVSAEFVNVEER